jgi:hypothetical protein
MKADVDAFDDAAVFDEAGPELARGPYERKRSLKTGTACTKRTC